MEPPFPVLLDGGDRSTYPTELTQGFSQITCVKALGTMPSTLKQLSYELGIVIWIINIKNLLGWQLECCVQVSCLVLSPVLIFFTNGNKKIAVLLSNGTFHTCPSSSWWLPCSETHIKAILWIGWPGRISLPLLLCSSDSPPSFLPPGLRVWPFLEKGKFQ